LPHQGVVKVGGGKKSDNVVVNGLAVGEIEKWNGLGGGVMGSGRRGGSGREKVKGSVFGFEEGGNNHKKPRDQRRGRAPITEGWGRMGGRKNNFENGEKFKKKGYSGWEGMRTHEKFGGNKNLDNCRLKRGEPR